MTKQPVATVVVTFYDNNAYSHTDIAEWSEWLKEAMRNSPHPPSYTKPKITSVTLHPR